MYLRRKIDAFLEGWKASNDRKPLIIKGPRQVGKTESILHFARAHYPHILYINFVEEPKFKQILSDGYSEENILRNISILSPEVALIPHETLLVFDEIQVFPDIATSLKFFKLKGNYDVILSGSMLGLNYRRIESNSVGYKEDFEMTSMDFEEFLWANGINDAVIDSVRTCFEKETPVPDGIHKAMMELLYRYVIVGGLPEVVNCFLETKNIELIYKVQRNLIGEYEEDMVKYADDSDKPHIRECFESIPTQLAKENKKFQYSVVKKGGRASQYMGSIQWLEDAGIVQRCYNTSITELPLDGNAIKDCFKVYTTDIGILMAMLNYGTQIDILKGNLLGYKGAIFENLMADFLCKSGQKLYYFHKESGLELDFLVRFKGECVVLEVKAKAGKAKSMTTVLKNKDVYHVNNAIKLGQYNVGREGDVLTIPLYMGFLIQDKLTDAIIPEVDLGLLTNI